MRNYVIINGVNSLTIPGLAIKSLPPITKPIQRTLREEIDGRDGDIITELGYGAYDKEIEIGLFGDFDVDQVIAYFNQKGTITFSNEPDKVYYFQALNQVDYEELIKFREAGVELHCQPFKYPVTEEPLIEEYEYVTGSGETITLDNTEETTFNEIELQGNTEQFQTTGKNLLELIDAPITIKGVTFTPNADGSVSITGTSTGVINQAIININNPPIIEAGTYTRSVKTVGTITKNNNYVLLMGRNSQNENVLGDMALNGNTTTTRTTTTTGTNTMSNIGIFISGAGAVFDCTLYIQLEKSATATDWEPYTGGNPAPNPDYPEDIHVVSGDNEIKIVGKNLLKLTNETKTDRGITGTISNDNEITYSGSATQAYSNCTNEIPFILPSGTYTFSIDHATTNNERIVLYLLGGTSQTIVIQGGSTSYTFTSNGTNTSARIGLTNLTSGNSYSGTFKMQLEKNSTQTTYAPYTEDTYSINLPVENLYYMDYTDRTDSFHETEITLTKTGYSITGTSDTSTGYTLVSRYISLKAGEYGVSLKQKSDLVIRISKRDYSIIATIPIGSLNTSMTLSEDTDVCLTLSIVNGTTYDESNEIMISPGSKANSYTPYGTEPIEMAEIPETDYHDTFIRGNDEKWYKEENIKKVIYNGSSGEAWTYYQGIVFIDDTDIKDLGLTNNTFLLSNYFTAGTGRFYIAHSTRQRIHINLNAVGLNTITNVTQWKEWLGTHNLEILFVRNENLIEITGDLADQLEALWRATSKRGQTNITQTNNDLPFFMIVSALELGSDVITIPDGGNIYSKPTIKLEGTGIVDIYLNDVQEFEVDLTEDNEITIDTEKMEAYTETGLANRKVTGDYSKFKLQPGDNVLRFSGDLTKATITRYTRWL